ncbi:hypothetical protein GETHOR_21610 [Geothrix oryzae]|uniref:Methyltransferase type 11 domain-containing protein n=1 Tax=Geothrix oryzae TaxID=2927975 RepID=A0ABM8DSX7_9BACT|nr:hypothetical protein GETHOR_21610 [Geothrix oryzae]
MGVDDPRTTLLRRRLLQSKPFLRCLYLEWYSLLAARIQGLDPVLELGSGGGFLSEFRAGVIQSDLIRVPGLSLSADACRLPFKEGRLGAIVMTNVLHHIPDVAQFIAEAVRCLRPGGHVVMVEPWNTVWSQQIYRHLHNEPFDPGATWKFPFTGPLSSANNALPWILFRRDRARFEETFPKMSIDTIQPMMPFAYLLSGGVSRPIGAPGWSYRSCRTLERRLALERLGLFALIDLKRRS